MGHEHDNGNKRRVIIALVLTGTFMIVEVVGGILSGSLALLADAGHMLTDTAALVVAFGAARLANRPADRRRSYGYERVRVLAALVNSLALLALVLWLAVEAAQRLLEPRPVDARLMLTIALVGAAINVGVALLLRAGRDKDLNLGAAYLHVLSDLAGSVAAALAAMVILATGWTRADPLLSLLIAALIARVAIGLLRRSSHILLEGAPEGLEPDKLARELTAAVREAQDVHHVHAWSLDSREVLVTLHARIGPGQDPDEALAAIKRVLDTRWGITHSTIQIERSLCHDPE